MKPSKPQIKLSDKQLEVLRNHVRVVHGLDVPCQKMKKIVVKEPRLKLNSAHTVRMECIKKRRQFMNKAVVDEEKERIKIKHHISRKRRSIQFHLNKAFHMRWKNVRRLPVLSSHDRKVFNDTGKLPFVVPAFYKPFRPHDTNWSNQEFIFLDENEEKKKKEAASSTLQPTPQLSTSSSSISTGSLKSISTSALPDTMALTTTLAIK